MLRQHLDTDDHHSAVNHYNLRCAGGSVAFNRVTARELKELSAATIEWAWCGKEKRELTLEEIKKMCARQ